MANPSLQIGSGNWAIKADELLGYRVVGNKYFPVPIDVSRATAATRVDEAGLVNYAEVLGGEDVVNGDFATDTVWNRTGTWSIESNYATANGNSTSQYIQQDFTITNGKTYLFTYEIIENTLNGNGASLSGSGGFVSVSLSSAIGTHQVYITADDDAAAYALKIGVSGTATTGTIKLDNVSVKEVTRDNVPRIDYTGGGCPHILAEPQRTNLFPYSEDFTNGAWSKINATVALSSELSPDGTLNAYKVTATDTDQPRVEDGIPTVAVNTTYTFSFFAKKGNTSFVAASRFSGGQSAIFNLDTGAIVSSTTDDVSITALDNEWFKVSITQEVLSADGYNIWKINLTNGTSASTGVEGEYVHIYGAQLEEGSYPTSYIPTSGATVTRNQDIFTRDGISSLINSTEGVLFVEMAALSDDLTDRRISLNDGSNANEIIIGYSRFTGNIIGEVFSGGSIQNSNWAANGVTQTNNNKFALSWGGGTMKFYLNGLQTNIETGVTSPVGLNTLELSIGNDTLNMFAKVKQLQVYPTALSDAELTTLTTP